MSLVKGDPFAAAQSPEELADQLRPLIPKHRPHRYRGMKIGCFLMSAPIVLSFIALIYGVFTGKSKPRDFDLFPFVLIPITFFLCAFPGFFLLFSPAFGVRRNPKTVAVLKAHFSTLFPAEKGWRHPGEMVLSEGDSPFPPVQFFLPEEREEYSTVEKNADLLRRYQSSSGEARLALARYTYEVRDDDGVRRIPMADGVLFQMPCSIVQRDVLILPNAKDGQSHFKDLYNEIRLFPQKRMRQLRVVDPQFNERYDLHCFDEKDGYRVAQPGLIEFLLQERSPFFLALTPETLFVFNGCLISNDLVGPMDSINGSQVNFVDRNPRRSLERMIELCMDELTISAWQVPGYVADSRNPSINEAVDRYCAILRAQVDDLEGFGERLEALLRIY